MEVCAFFLGGGGGGGREADYKLLKLQHVKIGLKNQYSIHGISMYVKIQKPFTRMATFYENPTLV